MASDQNGQADSDTPQENPTNPLTKMHRVVKGYEILHESLLAVHRVKLDPDRVPVKLHPLIPLAEKWGISDDVAREHLVGQLDESERESIRESIESYSSDIWDWLGGENAMELCQEKEYIAFSCLAESFL
jgi:hypothetical protein